MTIDMPFQQKITERHTVCVMCTDWGMNYWNRIFVSCCCKNESNTNNIINGAKSSSKNMFITKIQPQNSERYIL